MTATPIKLRSGDWGAKTQGSAYPGDTITITTKSGKSWEAVVDRVVWSGDGVSICATRKAPRRERSYWGTPGDYCGYPCPVSRRTCNAKNGPCHDCE